MTTRHPHPRHPNCRASAPWVPLLHAVAMVFRDHRHELDPDVRLCDKHVVDHDDTSLVVGERSEPVVFADGLGSGFSCSFWSARTLRSLPIPTKKTAPEDYRRPQSQTSTPSSRAESRGSQRSLTMLEGFPAAVAVPPVAELHYRFSLGDLVHHGAPIFCRKHCRTPHRDPRPRHARSGRLPGQARLHTPLLEARQDRPRTHAVVRIARAPTQ